MGGRGNTKDQPAGEFFGETDGERFVSEGVFIVEIVSELEQVVAILPVFEAALFPFGEILFGDGAAEEFLVKDGLDLGKRIEPKEEGLSGLVVFEAAIELVADGMREASDFAGAGVCVRGNRVHFLARD